ncbi:TadE/TadG family type IV pilus assembly protein [Pseudonocardia bannensis]|uniref:Pilus assembly protein n=1 Tax=Pseudonocardia bannensis TaxID=630973 RepID=A0A848DMW8_9PSEU|nr:TadE/TadG family type IV pilus assembly protein [Pseudonocardia bannensis]NMH94092.1 pilus assembly protein [Pseudonocardia bannensis]
MRRLRRHDPQRGAAAVEFALVLPLLVLLLFGIVDFARAFHTQLTLSDAAAEGARTLATGGTLAAARSAVGSVLQVTAVAPAAVSYPLATVCPATAVPGTVRAAMTVSTRFEFVTPLIGSLAGGGLTISGTAARQCAA